MALLPYSLCRQEGNISLIWLNNQTGAWFIQPTETSKQTQINNFIRFIFAYYKNNSATK